MKNSLLLAEVVVAVVVPEEVVVAVEVALTALRPTKVVDVVVETSLLLMTTLSPPFEDVEKNF